MDGNGRKRGARGQRPGREERTGEELCFQDERDTLVRRGDGGDTWEDCVKNRY